MSQIHLSLGFQTRSDTNWAVQPQKMARGLKFRIFEEEELYNEVHMQNAGFLMTRLTAQFK